MSELFHGGNIHNFVAATVTVAISLIFSDDNCINLRNFFSFVFRSNGNLCSSISV
ncbi:MAG: hypothetical protein IKU39_05785 [Lachnospiraceae bacterium]|nr:hypothetical protein [Lachnospiraceae bacterium]